jgi:GT2 family glycosyltransferase
MRIGIGVHTTNTVDAAVYFNHVMTFAKWAKRYDLAFIGMRRVKIEKACNLTVTKLRRLGCTHVLFVDDDHILQDDMLEKLLATAEREHAAMVSGLICKRLFPFETIGFARRGAERRLSEIPLPSGVGPVEVDACAFGCTLVDLERLQRLPMPWFETVPGRRFDVNFCNKLRDAGEHVFVDTNVSVGHVMDPTVVWPENATELRATEITQRLRTVQETEDAG